MVYNQEAERKRRMTEEKNVNAQETADKDSEIKSEEEKKEKKMSKKEADAFKKEIDDLKAKLDEQTDKYLRIVAEYDNYRKRVLREKDEIYGDAYIDAVKEILPVLDNLERAVAFSDSGNLAEGVNMTLNMFRDVFKKMGIEEIATENVEFDPNYHNAIMHIEDEQLGENMVAQTISKGYKKGDKIIRYAMVKVAN